MGNSTPKFNYLLKEVKDEIQKQKEEKIKHWLEQQLRRVECLKKEVKNTNKDIAEREERIRKVCETGELPQERGYEYINKAGCFEVMPMGTVGASSTGMMGVLNALAAS